MYCIVSGVSNCTSTVSNVSSRIVLYVTQVTVFVICKVRKIKDLLCWTTKKNFAPLESVGLAMIVFYSIELLSTLGLAHAFTHCVVSDLSWNATFLQHLK